MLTQEERELAARKGLETLSQIARFLKSETRAAWLMESLVTGKIDNKTPREVLKDSDDCNRRLLAEAREAIFNIADDDPNREYW
eukprot:3066184-Karenia_brevis.AAC.1